MKYFTADLWNKIQYPETYAEASSQWDINLAEYMKVYNSIKHRLPTEFLNTYHQYEGFHDYHLESIKVNNYENKSDPSVEIIISEFGNSFLITYKDVSRFRTSYEKGNWAGFDDWGYDEFLPVDNKYLTHEILFASGSSILLQFKNRSITIEKIV